MKTFKRKFLDSCYQKGEIVYSNYFIMSQHSKIHIIQDDQLTKFHIIQSLYALYLFYVYVIHSFLFNCQQYFLLKFALSLWWLFYYLFAQACQVSYLLFSYQPSMFLLSVKFYKHFFLIIPTVFSKFPFTLKLPHLLLSIVY